VEPLSLPCGVAGVVLLSLGEAVCSGNVPRGCDSYAGDRDEQQNGKYRSGITRV
jgi:hypothetical protein